MLWLLYLIPAFVIVIFFGVVIFINHESMNIMGDPQDTVGKVCRIEYSVSEKVDHTLVLFQNKKYRLLKLSTYKNTIEQHTRVLIVKYEPDTDSYKIERYE